MPPPLRVLDLVGDGPDEAFPWRLVARAARLAGVLPAPGAAGQRR